MAEIPAFCLECDADIPDLARACPACGARRIARHEELHTLQIAHIDCDAFYAAVEKRDDPGLVDKPVIVGGAVRGVVTTACYIARTYGVKSAMPMFEARRRCPSAVVIRPDFAKYADAARQVRERMFALTPMVEPVSIDEAFVDLSGTARLHAMSPARSLAKLQREIRRELGFTVSVGLSCNKFLAKLASELDKPNGFSVIGAKEAKSRIAPMPVRAIWGVGPALEAKLRRDSIATIADLQQQDAAHLGRRYGDSGLRLARLSHGEDSRKINPVRETKSVSTETTFNVDLRNLRDLEDALWPLCEKASARMKEKRLEGRVITLKLKTDDFHAITRRVALPDPTNLARTAFDTASPLLAREADGRAFRLIGIGFSELETSSHAMQNELFPTPEGKKRREEHAMDKIREKFGADGIALGRSLAKKKPSRQNRDND